jgi:inner membrane transporter RhtA
MARCFPWRASLEPVGLVCALLAGIATLNFTALPLALAVAVLSSAPPYMLETQAMTRKPTHVFGIFMCVEPAIAALFWFAMPGERVTPLQCVAIGCVMLASLGAAVTGERSTIPPG